MRATAESGRPQEPCRRAVKGQLAFRDLRVRFALAQGHDFQLADRRRTARLIGTAATLLGINVQIAPNTRFEAWILVESRRTKLYNSGSPSSSALARTELADSIEGKTNRTGIIWKADRAFRRQCLARPSGDACVSPCSRCVDKRDDWLPELCRIDGSHKAQKGEKQIHGQSDRAGIFEMFNARPPFNTWQGLRFLLQLVAEGTSRESRLSTPTPASPLPEPWPLIRDSTVAHLCD